MKQVPEVACCALAIACIWVVAVSGQTQVRLTAPTVMDELRAKLLKEPAISSRRIADIANRLAAVQGYSFGFDPGTFKEKSVTIGGVKLASFDLRRTNGKKLRFIAAKRDEHPCGTSTEFPVSWVKGNDFALVSSSRTYAVHIPRQFGRDEMVLADRMLRGTLRHWQVPMDSVPEAISSDGTKIYVGTELDQLYLEINSTGKYRYVASDAQRLIIKHVDIKTFPKDRNNDYLGFRQFIGAHGSYFVKFSWPCT